MILSANKAIFLALLFFLSSACIAEKQFNPIDLDHVLYSDTFSCIEESSEAILALYKLLVSSVCSAAQGDFSKAIDLIHDYEKQENLLTELIHLNILVGDLEEAKQILASWPKKNQSSLYLYNSTILSIYNLDFTSVLSKESTRYNSELPKWITPYAKTQYAFFNSSFSKERCKDLRDINKLEHGHLMVMGAYLDCLYYMFGAEKVRKEINQLVSNSFMANYYDIFFKYNDGLRGSQLFDYLNNQSLDYITKLSLGNHFYDAGDIESLSWLLQNINSSADKEKYYEYHILSAKISQQASDKKTFQYNISSLESMQNDSLTFLWAKLYMPDFQKVDIRLNLLEKILEIDRNDLIAQNMLKKIYFENGKYLKWFKMFFTVTFNNRLH